MVQNYHNGAGKSTTITCKLNWKYQILYVELYTKKQLLGSVLPQIKISHLSEHI